uniref:Ig-like domain-containing protein n=1 Tax=Anabas testudineus TaxID=64144 RepID=A0A7N6AGA1_ANATE
MEYDIWLLMSSGVKLVLSLKYLKVCTTCCTSVQINLTAEPGDTVTLPCRALTHNTTVSTVKWIRPDLEPEDIFLYQDNHQYPTFKNRVELKEEQVKDGDLSLNLKNVRISDTGTYECRCSDSGL